MPTNTKTNAEKAAIKRRQRKRIADGALTRKEEVDNTDLLGEIAKDETNSKAVRAVARLADRHMGVASKLTPGLASKILQYTLEGNYIATAVSAAGISHQTFITWQKKAESAIAEAEKLYAESFDAEAKRTEAKEDDDSEVDEEDSGEDGEKSVRAELSPRDFIPSTGLIYVHLVESLSIAEAHGEMRLLRRAASGERGWQGAMAILERRYSDKWAKQETKKHIVEGDADKPVVITYESDSERQKRVASILQRAGAIEGSATELSPLDPVMDTVEGNG